MTQAIVQIPVADLRRDPDHRSERVSQLLYGNTITILDSQDKFCRVKGVDSYEGWIGKDYLLEADSPLGELRTVRSRFALMRFNDKTHDLWLPYGANIPFDKATGSYHHLPSNELLICVEGKLQDNSTRHTEIISDAFLFYGAPYLWGGTTPFGTDCSGLTQAVYRSAGVELPRDSKDQAKVGKEVTIADAREGDLFHFPGHVAIYIGNREIIHSTRMRGMVCVESLDPAHPNYRSDLADQITTIRRIKS